MAIKYAARRISTQMRTPEELVFEDGVTLKPVDGGDVFVAHEDNDTMHVGTDYNASTGGCTVNGVVYESEYDLNNVSYYVILSAFSAYDFATETIVGIGFDNEGYYITPNYFYSKTLLQLATRAGCYRTDTVPTQAPARKISDGTAGTRYTGSLGDAAVKDANGNFYYYNTVLECDAVWSATVPLCFTAEQAGSSVKLGKGGSGTTGFTYSYKYSMDNVHWNDYIIGSVIILTNVGDKVFFKGSRSDQSILNYMRFEMTGRISASGSVNSMLSENFEEITDLTTFGTLTFYRIFYGCTSLTSAPELPATTLASNCYSAMFSGCTSLQTAPVLPATTLASNCYSAMFSGCTSLNEVKCYAIDISASNFTLSWLSSVSSTGIFYKAVNVDWPSGVSGIPSRWSVVEVKEPLELLVAMALTSGGFHEPLPTYFQSVSDYNGVNIPGLYSQAFADKVNGYCGTIPVTGTGLSTYWNVCWNDEYNYELIGLYDDDNGTQLITKLNVSDFYFVQHPNNPLRLAIKTTNPDPNTPVTTLRIRITQK